MSGRVGATNQERTKASHTHLFLLPPGLLLLLLLPLFLLPLREPSPVLLKALDRHVLLAELRLELHLRRLRRHQLALEGRVRHSRSERLRALLPLGRGQLGIWGTGLHRHRRIMSTCRIAAPQMSTDDAHLARARRRENPALSRTASRTTATARSERSEW